MTYTFDRDAIFDGETLMLDDIQPRAGEILASVLNRGEELTAENARLRAELAEAVRLLRDIPGMMGIGDWGDVVMDADYDRIHAVLAKNGI